jgi:hypothetical protein
MYLVFLLTILSGLTWAHQSTLTPDGNELFWSNPVVPMVIQTNTSDLSAATVTSVIQASINQWNGSSNAARINSVGSSNNEIKFSSSFPYGNAVIGVTELSYNTAGAIQKATIVLNDYYKFHGTPGVYAPREVFLGDVVSHELGHVFGLSHSEVLDATMFYSSFSGQSTIAFDDQSAIRQKYDSDFGKISGVVKGGNSIGVLGVHVQAISRKTGKASAVVTDENGIFELGGLNLEDTYYLYTSPIKNPDSLPGYFANAQDKFCPASYVGSFFSKCGHDQQGKPQGISLTGTIPEVDIGTVTINCGLKSNGDYTLQKLETTPGAVTIFEYDSLKPEKVEQAFVGWFRNPSSTSFSASDILKADFTELSGNGSLYLKFSLVSYPLGSQLEYEIDVKNNIMSYVSSQRSLAYSSVTDTYSTDFEAFVPVSSIASNNMFEIKVRSKKLGTSYTSLTFPSADTFSSSTFLPYLVVVSLWEEQAGVKVPVVHSEANLSDNAACLEAPFTYAVSKTRAIGDDASASTDQVAAAAGCGTIEPPKSGPGSNLGIMTLGFLLSLMATSLRKTRKKFLS